MNEAESLSAVESLYFRWLALRTAGKPVPADALCRDRPHLLPALESRIAAEHPTDEPGPTGEYTPRPADPPQANDAEGTGAYEPQTPDPPAAGDAPETPAGGRYEVVAEHARGGMGRVCTAIDTELSRRVAFKDIQEKYADDPAARHRFTREALITGQLEHPGVIPVYGLGTDAHGRPFYAMRFVEGESLRDAVKGFHAHPPKREPVGAKAVAFRGLLKRFADVCNAVAFAHSRRIVHRDLKPANVMLGPFGETLVVDWGLARSFADRSADLPGAPRAAAAPGGEETADLQGTAVGDGAGTRTGQVMGSPAYMSPEQAAGELRTLGPAWDIYSLGATLYELLTGRPPFTGKPVAEILAAIRTGGFAPPRAAARWVPKPLDAIVRKAMALKPADRYASALDLAADIERYLADAAVQAHRESLPERARRWAKRHPVLVRTALALLIVGTPVLAADLVVVLDAKRGTDRALGSERKALDQTRAALTAEERSLAQVRATLDLTTDALVGKILAKQSRLGPDERAFLEKLVASYADFAAPGSSPRQQAMAARARLRIAQIRERLGDAAGAATEYRGAIVALKGLSAAPDADPALTRDLGTAHLGHAATVLPTDPRAAIAAMTDGLHIREAAFLADRQNLDRLKEVADATIRGADLLVSGGQNATAEKLYRQYIGTYLPLVERRVFGADVAEALGRAYDQLAFLEEQKKPPRYDEAYQTLNGAVEVFTKLEEYDRTEPRYRHLRARARASQVLLLIRAGKHEEAERVIVPLVETYRDLVLRYPAVREFRAGLALALSAQVGALNARGKRAEARRVLEESRAVLARLTSEYPEHQLYRDGLVTVLRTLQKEYLAVGRLDDAIQAGREADEWKRTAPPPP